MRTTPGNLAEATPRKSRLSDLQMTWPSATAEALDPWLVAMPSNSYARLGPNQEGQPSE